MEDTIIAFIIIKEQEIILNEIVFIKMLKLLYWF